MHQHLAVMDAAGIKLRNSVSGTNNSGVKFRPEWIFYHPNGNTEVLPGGSILNPQEAINRAKKYVNV